MGVSGLWPLLEPVGRRVNIEALTNKRLAVDASIWLVQFIKAMRNEKGEMLHNAHLLGFFRRICRLLFHRIRPVFVFDGATPAIKKRTTIARRRRREEQGAKLRKTAEKLLLNQLKKHALGKMSEAQQATVLQAQQSTALDEDDEVPADLRMAAGDISLQKDSMLQETQAASSQPASAAAVAPQAASTAGDALLAAQLQNEDKDKDRIASNAQASTSAMTIIHGKPFTRRNSTFQGHLAPISSVDQVDLVMAELLKDPKAASATHNILGYRVYNEALGKMEQDYHDDGEGGAGIKIMYLLQDSSVRNVMIVVSRWFGGMLLGPARFMYITDAARGVLDQGGYTQKAPAAAPKPAPMADLQPMEESSSSEEEEAVILPEGIDELDPTVLATLPPSLQLEFALKLRERKQAENREHFQKHTGKPTDFSSFQMQQYLKGSQLKREMEKMKDAVNAAASGEGIPTRRIAGDAGREYILQTTDDVKHTGQADAGISGELSIGGDNTRMTDSGHLEFEIEVPTELTDSQKLPSGNMGSDEEEWETVGEEGGSQGPSPETSFSTGKNWRERMSNRHKYWSRMTGFQFGRKLGDWGKDGEEEEEAKEEQRVKASEVEDAELQEAIARSLQEAAEGANTSIGNSNDDADDDDDDVEWMDTELLPSDEVTNEHQSHAAAATAAAQQAVVHLPSASVPPMQKQPSRKASLHAPKPPLPPTVAAQRSQAAKQKPSTIASEQNQAAAAPAPAAGFDFSFMQGSKSAASKKAHTQAQTEPSSSAAQEQAPRQDAEVRGAELDQPSLPQDQPSLPQDQPFSPQHQEAFSPEDLSNISPFKQAQSPKAAPSKSAATLASPGHKAKSEGLKQHPSDDPVTSNSSSAVLEGSQGEAAPASDAHPSTSPSTSPFKSPQAQRQAPIASAKPASSIPAATKALAQNRPKRRRPGEQSDSHSAVDHLQHIMQETAPLTADATTDSVLLDTLQEVPDDMPMPFSIQDRGMWVTEGAVLGYATDNGPDSNAGLKKSVQQAAPGSVAQLAADLPHAEVEDARSGAQSGASAQAAASAQRAAPDLATSAQGGTDQPNQQQQQQSLVRGNPAADHRGMLQDQADASGQYQSTGLPEYASGALEPAPSGASSGALPSFDLDAEMDQLEKQGKRLQSQHRAQVRNADSPTNEMYGECQELLQMFGLPYIIAPMEAEAQCAWLDAAKLVDGVVTDDNDVFLFGGEHVYRNIFEGKKYVEEYRTQDVASELGMSRDKLIQLALLLGSDYTEGVAGIGIVNAVEIVNAFPTEDLLINFRKWVLTPDVQLLKGVGASVEVDADEHVRHFKHTHAGMRKNWDVPETFPNAAVIKAYKSAKVDESRDKFTYGRPDLQLLRQFCLDKFSWSQDKADELLVPVLKAYDDNQKQMTLDSFLSFSQRFAKIKSRRLQNAVAGMTGVANPEIAFGDTVEEPPPKKRRKAGKAAAAADVDQGNAAAATAHSDPPADSPADAAAGQGEPGGTLEPAELRRTGADEAVADAAATIPAKRGRGRRRGGVGQSSQRKAATPKKDEKESQASKAAARGRAKGTGRGSIQGRGKKQGKSGAISESEPSASSSDSDGGDKGQRSAALPAEQSDRQLRQRSNDVSQPAGPNAGSGEGVLGGGHDDEIDWEAAMPDL